MTFSTAQYETYPQYLCHPVFRAARAIAMRLAHGKCQCGAPATEVHHWKDRPYPPWGMFDVPSNLLPICHACHCKEHGK